MTIENVAAEISGHRFSYVTEAVLQRSLWRILQAAFPGKFVAEAVIGKSGRIDFYAKLEGIGIEVKAYGQGGTMQQTIRQLARYAALPEVTSLLLVAGSPRIVAHMPPRLAGKQILCVTARGSLA